MENETRAIADIGNTFTSLAVGKKNRLQKIKHIKTADFNLACLRSFARQNYFSRIVISCVVPKKEKIFTAFQRQYKIYFVKKNIAVPITSKYNLKQLGPDRMVNVFAALKLYPRFNVIVSMGTALTIDFIKNKTHWGGFIFPGAGLSLEALKSCALLKNKKISFKNLKEEIPRGTSKSIALGVKEGYTALINGIVGKYGRKIGINPRVIVSGGGAQILRKGIFFPNSYKPNLVLEGLLRLDI